MAIRKTPTGPKRPPIAWCDAICRRFLKPDQNINWKREMPTFTRLFKAYPSQRFWEVYDLPFGNGTLNMMTWFDSVEGKEELARAWLLFNYQPPESDKIVPPSETALDTSPQPVYNPPCNVTPARPCTVAEFLKQP